MTMHDPQPIRVASPPDTLRRAARAVVIAFVTVVLVLARPIGPAAAQTSSTTPTSSAGSTSSAPSAPDGSTTLDPTSETAPILELTPDDSTPSNDTDDSSSSSDDGQKVAIFAAAILLPLAGIAFLIWYARRMTNAANARSAERASSSTPDDSDTDDG